MVAAAAVIVAARRQKSGYRSIIKVFLNYFAEVARGFACGKI